MGVDADHNQSNVAVLSGLTPQANNILYVGFTGANGGDGYLNALRLDVAAVPEPASALLVAGGALLALRRRR